MTHGTRTTYQSGCRCEDCKAANADFQKQYRSGQRSGRSYAREPAPIKHGTRNAYVHRGCRCDDCSEANRAYQRGYMRLRRSGVSTTDPLIEQALNGTVVNTKGKALRRKPAGM